jgi:hypothetical protein
MRPVLQALAFFLLWRTNSAFSAIQYITYPVLQPPECQQAYEKVLSPHTLEAVFSSLEGICMERGGVRVIYKELIEGNSSEPTDILYSCIAKNPADYVLFNCRYGSRYEI